MTKGGKRRIIFRQIACAVQQVIREARDGLIMIKPLCSLQFIFIFLLTLTLFTLFSLPAHAAFFTEVRVKITLQSNYVELSFEDVFKLSGETKEDVLLQPGRYRLVAAENRIQLFDLTGKSLGVYSAPLSLKAAGAGVAKEGSFTLHNARYGREYRGALEVHLEGQGLMVVNLLAMESYLRGVLPREMPSSWGNYGGMEALKAQAVAARTYALQKQQQNQHNPFHLCDTQLSQVYGGIMWETKNTDGAVEETQGVILTFNNRVIAPFYHATNGGYTEDSGNVWRESLPYITGRHDPYDDPDNPLELINTVVHRYALWEMDIPVSRMGQLVSTNDSTISGNVEQLTVASVFPSGRVNELQVFWTGGQVLSFFKERARTVLGLRSQLFTVRNEPEPRVWIASSINGIEKKTVIWELEGKWAVSAGRGRSMLTGVTHTALSAGGRGTVPYLAFVFEGRGFGHGIGMSQNGAYNRSRAGHSYQEILSFYYPGTETKEARQ